MLNQRQQAEIKSIAKRCAPMHLWYGGAAELVARPTPMTQSIVIKVLNQASLYLKAAKMIRLPVYRYAHPMVVNVLGKSYLNLNAENHLYFGKCGVTITPSEKGGKPKVALKLTMATWWPALVYTLKNAKFAATLFQTSYLERLNTPVTRSQATGYLQNLHYLKRALTEVVALGMVEGFLDVVLEQVIKPRYGIKWPRMEQALWRRYTTQDTYYLSTQSLNKVTAGKITFDDYLMTYGVRSFDDFELASPRFWEIPETIRQLIQSGKTETDEQNENNLDSEVVRDKRWLEAVFRLKAMRGTRRMASLSYIDGLRQSILKLGAKHHVPPELLFFLTIDELRNWNTGLIEMAQKRLAEANEDEVIRLPDYLGAMTELTEEPSYKSIKEYTGLTLAPGKAEGILVKVASETEQIESNLSILYLPDASPRYSHLYAKARGIIVGSGGMGSHGAILAREYGIPAISLGGNKLPFRSGEAVKVDGDLGVVTAFKD